MEILYHACFLSQIVLFETQLEQGEKIYKYIFYLTVVFFNQLGCRTILKSWRELMEMLLGRMLDVRGDGAVSALQTLTVRIEGQCARLL